MYHVIRYDKVLVSLQKPQSAMTNYLAKSYPPIRELHSTSCDSKMEVPMINCECVFAVSVDCKEGNVLFNNTVIW